MSPTAAVGSARSHLNPATWSLSSKLVATVVGLFLAVTLASGALTVLLLHQSLVRQLDNGVTASLVRAGGPDRGRPDDGGGAHVAGLRTYPTPRMVWIIGSRPASTFLRR